MLTSCNLLAYSAGHQHYHIQRSFLQQPPTRKKFREDLRGKRKRGGYTVKQKFTKVFSCAHGKRIKKGALRKGNWLKRSSRTFKDLFSKLTKKQLVEDIQHCSSFHHTGSLENYHNVRLKYLPKRISYTRASTAIKSMVAIIEVNENAAIAPGERKMYAVYSKAKAGWVLKKTHVKKDYGYRKNIMANILNRIVIQKPLSIDMTEYIPDNLPKNIAPVPKPSIDELMKKHRSRMAMS